MLSNLEWNISKENQAPTQKLERPNRKIEKMFDLGQDLVPPAHLRVPWSDFSEDLNRIKTNEEQLHYVFVLFYA